MNYFKAFVIEALLDIDNKSLTHRSDLWGHYGMAREFAAVSKYPLNPFPCPALQVPSGTKMSLYPHLILKSERSASVTQTFL